MSSAYEVVVPPELADQWAALPSKDHERLNERLELAARGAKAKAKAWPQGAPGIHRGRHRAIVEEMWLLYRLNEQAHTVNLLGFGRVTPG